MTFLDGIENFVRILRGTNANIDTGWLLSVDHFSGGAKNVARAEVSNKDSGDDIACGDHHFPVLYLPEEDN